VEVPPKIEADRAREVPIEVLPPESGYSRQRTDPARDPIPVHALSALALVAVDSLWALFEFAPPLWILAIPTCFLAVFLPVYLIQRHLKGDSPGRALAFATLLATLAAVPTPIMGTPVGLGLLAWTGLGRLLGRPAPRS
jgi:hypothetical protein